MISTKIKTITIIQCINTRSVYLSGLVSYTHSTSFWIKKIINTHRLQGIVFFITLIYYTALPYIILYYNMRRVLVQISSTRKKIMMQCTQLLLKINRYTTDINILRIYTTNQFTEHTMRLILSEIMPSFIHHLCMYIYIFTNMYNNNNW